MTFLCNKWHHSSDYYIVIPQSITRSLLSQPSVAHASAMPLFLCPALPVWLWVFRHRTLLRSLVVCLLVCPLFLVKIKWKRICPCPCKWFGTLVFLMKILEISLLRKSASYGIYHNFDKSQVLDELHDFADLNFWSNCKKWVGDHTST